MSINALARVRYSGMSRPTRASRAVLRFTRSTIGIGANALPYESTSEPIPPVAVELHHQAVCPHLYGRYRQSD